MNARLPFLAYFCKHDTAKYCLDTLVIGVDAQQCPPRQPTKNQVSLEKARFHGHILRLEVKLHYYKKVFFRRPFICQRRFSYEKVGN
mgnify:CR=1 FL=1